MDMVLKVDPKRFGTGDTGIFVRALDEKGKWGSFDVCDLEHASLVEWMKKGDAKFLERLVCALLGHGEPQVEEVAIEQSAKRHKLGIGSRYQYCYDCGVEISTPMSDQYGCPGSVPPENVTQHYRATMARGYETALKNVAKIFHELSDEARQRADLVTAGIFRGMRDKMPHLPEGWEKSEMSMEGLKAP